MVPTVCGPTHDRGTRFQHCLILQREVAMRVFISYNFDDEPFAQRISYYLRKQPGIEPFCYADEKRAEDWIRRLGEELERSDAFVFLLGKEVGKTQADEANTAYKLGDKITRFVVVNMGDVHLSTDVSISCGRPDPIRLPSSDLIHGMTCARDVVGRLGRLWVPDNDLPIGYPFDFEKKIIEEYEDGKGVLSGTRVEEGCPRKWPRVVKDTAVRPNPVRERIIGGYREETASIIADNRIGWREDHSEQEISPIARGLTFPEAGPRRTLRYPVRGSLTVGIVVSGGIAPGINAAIEGIVRRHRLYAEKAEEKGEKYELAIFGYKEGLQGLLTPGNPPLDLLKQPVERWAEEGGSKLRTSRAEELLDKDPVKRTGHFKELIARLINTDGVEILYIIGGDGSIKAAHAIWKMARDAPPSRPRERNLSVVAIPKTMDNDILWVWQSFGFLSAVEKSREVILNLDTEGTSNPRLGIIQLFGSDSGFVVSHAVLASGVCDAALIPEVHFKMRIPEEESKWAMKDDEDRPRSLFSHVERVLNRRHIHGESPHGLIVLAETAIPIDALDYVHDEHVRLSEKERTAVEEFINKGRRVEGQTPDELRSAGLKIVSRSLQKYIREKMGQDDPYWDNFRVFTNEPRHLIRSVPPSVSDVIFGERLGMLAVDNAMAGYTDFMVSQWLTEYVLVPLELAVLGRKRVPEKGIFWKSVLASTRQPARMCDCDRCLKLEKT